MCQARPAHFTRVGKSRTPDSTASFPISGSGLPGGEVIISWNRSKRARASSTVFPLMASVISDADAFEMAQPDPWNAASVMRPSVTVT